MTTELPTTHSVIRCAAPGALCRGEILAKTLSEWKNHLNHWIWNLFSPKFKYNLQHHTQTHARRASIHPFAGFYFGGLWRKIRKRLLYVLRGVVCFVCIYVESWAHGNRCVWVWVWLRRLSENEQSSIHVPSQSKANKKRRKKRTKNQRNGGTTGVGDENERRQLYKQWLASQHRQADTIQHFARKWPDLISCS